MNAPRFKPTPALPAGSWLGVLGGGQLGAEAVDLLVLRARDVAALRQHHLLEGGEVGTPGLGLAAQLVAQFVFQPAQRDVVGAAQRDPQQDEGRTGLAECFPFGLLCSGIGQADQVACCPDIAIAGRL